MIFSPKTLIISGFLFISSLIIISAMYLPLFSGENGFQAMESTFNSLRKGVRPPFAKLEKDNIPYLGRNFRATLKFSNNEKARTATLILLANKLTVTPRGRNINIQGDLGYTLKFIMEDIQNLYMNNFAQIEKRYSMPAIQTMYMLDRILKKLSVSLASQKMAAQERLVKRIRSELLIPAYNLREILPVSQTSGFSYLAMGTAGILFFAMIWDIANYFFFGTITSEGLMKPVRIMLGLELSDAQKDAIKKKKMLIAKRKAKIKKVKEARAKKKAEEMAEKMIQARAGQTTPKEDKEDDKQDQGKKIRPKKTKAAPAKKKTPQPAQSPGSKPGARAKGSSAAKGTQPKTQKKSKAAQAKTKQPSATDVRQKQKTNTQARPAVQEKPKAPEKKVVNGKKTNSSKGTSQTGTKKVTTRRESEKPGAKTPQKAKTAPAKKKASAGGKTQIKKDDQT